MTRLIVWLKGRRISSRSFSIPLESGDRGLYYVATIRYAWSLVDPKPNPRLLTPDALVRHLLREEMSQIARRFRLLDCDAAQNEMNAALCQGMRDADQRVRVDAHVRLRVAKSEKAVALKRATEEQSMRTAYARETVELSLLFDRLTDPTLGPIWWINRYADLQFAAGDPHAKVKSILAALSELRDTIHKAEIDQTSDLQVLVRRKIHEVFSAIQDEQSLRFALEVMNRTLNHMGVGEEENTTKANGRVK